MSQLKLDKQKKNLLKSKLIFGWGFPIVGTILLGIIVFFKAKNLSFLNISDALGLTLLVFVIISFIYFFLFVLHDFRHNLSLCTLDRDGLHLFNKKIKWASVEKTQHEFGFPSHLAIYFNDVNKRYKAVILNSKKLEEEIETFAKLHNSNFRNSIMPSFHSMNTRYYPSGIELSKASYKD